MEPELTPNPSVQPTPAASRRPRGLIIGLIAAALVVIGGLSWYFLASTPRDAVTHVDRAGYTATSGVGDAAALTAQPNETAVKYRGAWVVQACDVLTLADLRATGLHLTASSLPGTVARTYFDGQSQAGLPIDTLNLPLVSNDCTYRLQDSPGGLVQVTVHHPSYASLDAIMRTLDRQQFQPTSVTGLIAYKRPVSPSRPDDLEYMIQDNDYTADVRITLSGTGSAASKQKLLEAAAGHLKQLATHPTGPASFVYDSPVFKGVYANGCALLTAADFKDFHQAAPSPLVQENVAGAIGIVNYAKSQEGAEQPFNYIDHNCKRTTTDQSLRLRKSLTIETETYEDAWPAKAWMEFHKARATGTVALSQTIGDESYFGNNAGLDRALTFRRGRTIIQIGYTDPSETAGATVSERLLPLARTIAGRLNAFESR